MNRALNGYISISTWSTEQATYRTLNGALGRKLNGARMKYWTKQALDRALDQAYGTLVYRALRGACMKLSPTPSLLLEWYE